MATETAFRSEELFTQEEFWDWLDTVPAADLHRYELLGGRIIMTPPAGWGHGYIESNLHVPIGSHVRANGLGKTFGSSTGYDLPTGDTLEPDFAFVSTRRWGAGPKVRAGGKGFLAIVPDLVVEILSPSTATRDRTEKKDSYERSGVDEYWVVDPRKRQVTVFVREGDVFASPSTTSTGAVCSRVLPDLRVTVEEIFAELG
jgi:Uma2 family endonuclease